MVKRCLAVGLAAGARILFRSPPYENQDCCDQEEACPPHGFRGPTIQVEQYQGPGGRQQY